MDDKDETLAFLVIGLFLLICWKVGYWEGQQAATYGLTNEGILLNKN